MAAQLRAAGIEIKIYPPDPTGQFARVHDLREIRSNCGNPQSLALHHCLLNSPGLFTNNVARPRGNFVYILCTDGGLKGLKMDLSNAESQQTLELQAQHRSGTAHNHLIVRWFSEIRNCAEIWFGTRQQLLRPAYCARYLNHFRRSRTLRPHGAPRCSS